MNPEELTLVSDSSERSQRICNLKYDGDILDFYLRNISSIKSFQCPSSVSIIDSSSITILSL